MTIETLLVLVSLFDVVDVASKALAATLQLARDPRWLWLLGFGAFALGASITTDDVTDNTDPDADPIQDGFTNVNAHGHTYDAMRLTNSAAGSTAVGDVLAVSSQTAVLGDTQGSLQKFVVAMAVITNGSASDRWARKGIVSAKAQGSIAAMQYVRKSATARAIEDAGVAVAAGTPPPIGAHGFAVAAAAGGFCTVYLFERPTTSGTLDRTSAAVNVTGVTSETTLYTFTVKGGTLGTTGKIRLTLIGQFLNNTGAGRTFTPKIYYGATKIFDGALNDTSVVNNAAIRPMRITADLHATGATNTQSGQGALYLGGIVGVVGAPGDKSGSPDDQISHYSAMTEDSTADKVLKVTVTPANASVSITADSVLVELL